MTIYYTLNADTLSATFWTENAPENKVEVQGRWQVYAGARASKNNTRIIFSNLPSFCEPQKTITLNPNITAGSFTPKLNTKAHTGATSRKIFDYVKICDLPAYLEDENDIKALNIILTKAKRAFEKKQVEEQIRASINSHLAGLEKLGITKDTLLALLQAQAKESEQGGENEKE